MLRRRLTVLVAMVVMLAMMLASSGVASAAPGNRGQGGAHANPNATFGIITAVSHSGGGCDIACE